jgi:hypothetical protein
MCLFYTDEDTCIDYLKWWMVLIMHDLLIFRYCFVMCRRCTVSLVNVIDMYITVRCYSVLLSA